MTKFRPNLKYNYEDQWRAHLQWSEHTKDVTQAIDRSVGAYNEIALSTQSTIREAAHETQAAVREGAALVGEATLLAASAQIESERRNAAEIVESARWNAAQIVGAIELNSQNMLTVGRALDYRLSLLFDQEMVNTLLLQDIAEVLRIPDFQKERRYYIEQGFKHYQNAKIDPSLYSVALENLIKAEERENTDFFVLHRIGMIYLNVRALYDPIKAGQYFARAGRYAAVETSPQAVQISDVLNRGRALAVRPTGTSAVKRLAADAYDQAGFAFRLQERVPEAIEHSKRALELDPESLLIRFNQAKYLAADDQGDEAASLLEPVIRADRYYAGSAAYDPDLATTVEVVRLLERLRVEAADDLRMQMARIDALSAPFLGPQGGRRLDMQRLRDALQDGKYQVLMKGLDDVPTISAAAEQWRALLSLLGKLKDHLDSRLPITPVVAAAHSDIAGALDFGKVERIHSQLCYTPGQLSDSKSFAALVENSNIATAAAMKSLAGAAENVKQSSSRLDKVALNVWVEFNGERHQLERLTEQLENHRSDPAVNENLAALDYGAQRSLAGILSEKQRAYDKFANDTQGLLIELIEKCNQYRRARLLLRLTYLILVAGLFGIVLFYLNR